MLGGGGDTVVGGVLGGGGGVDMGIGVGLGGTRHGERGMRLPLALTPQRREEGIDPSNGPRHGPPGPPMGANEGGLTSPSDPEFP
ncbi:hypothetical protein L13192_06953 [Pyrenophora tritici-repentis]|uniref:Uncharacterized protein n=1 Tax=Pyrenophora tritici-repentis TaxID=45151 RepID=A0A922SYE1_9PLEO|nr:hypothetical protein Ptr86124_009351 [Pyrenophora tritici-repentis]KAI1669494.1 hypothetical protein L13192_06953 [Pyrenophora tritici-repentis]KAI1683608.1 hypothetical protein KJE20_06113 [Pyrenophora tritici-repentis]